MTRIALDTNVLAYAEGVVGRATDKPKIEISESILAALLDDLSWTPVAPVQALAELYHVLTRRAGRSPSEARNALQRMSRMFMPSLTDADVLATATEIASRHQLQIFDAIILAASAAAGCEVLLSEDMQDGFRVHGVTVMNPFKSRPDPLIAALLQE